MRAGDLGMRKESHGHSALYAGDEDEEVSVAAENPAVPRRQRRRARHEADVTVYEDTHGACIEVWILESSYSIKKSKK